nr:hypothetical protein [Tanacetum cinerariifolium]
MEKNLQENNRLLTQALSVEIMNVVVHDKVKSACLNVDVCAHCVTIESELKKDFIKKECYETLLQKYYTLEKHCISLEVNNQLKMEIFLRNTLSSPESALTFTELFKINDLKAQAQAKDKVILKSKEKLSSLNGDVNERKTYKQVYDSIKSSRVRLKKQCDDLINKVNLKSAEVSDLNASLQEKVLVITTLKEQLNKLKGKAVLTEAVSLKQIDPELLKVDVAPLVLKLHKNRSAHTDYIRHTQEEAATLREIVESERLLSPLNTSLDYACKYTRRIQELLMILQQTCPCLNELGTKLVAVTPKNKTKQIRLTEQITKSGKTTVATPPLANIDSNTHVLSSTGVTLVYLCAFSSVIDLVPLTCVMFEHFIEISIHSTSLNHPCCETLPSCLFVVIDNEFEEWAWSCELTSFWPAAATVGIPASLWFPSCASRSQTGASQSRQSTDPRRLDDGVVMLVLEARGCPLRFGEVHLSLVALNPKLEVFYTLSYDQLSGPLVNGRSENLLVFRWEVVQVTLKV